VAADLVYLIVSTHILPRKAQDEFRFFMDDAGSKLLVLPTQGNAAAEGAAAELGTPTATFSVTPSRGAISRPPGFELGFVMVRFVGGKLWFRARVGTMPPQRARRQNLARRRQRSLLPRQEVISQPCVLPWGWWQVRPSQSGASVCLAA